MHEKGLAAMLSQPQSILSQETPSAGGLYNERGLCDMQANGSVYYADVCVLCRERGLCTLQGKGAVLCAGGL